MENNAVRSQLDSICDRLCGLIQHLGCPQNPEFRPLYFTLTRLYGDLSGLADACKGAFTELEDIVRPALNETQRPERFQHPAM